jgi:oligoribonuclease
MATSDLLVWVDCEMTGLDLINDELIEVAVLVTDANLNVLGDGVDLVIKPSNRALEQMGDFVRGMHEASGLLSALNAGLPMAEAEERILEYVRSHMAEPGKAPLAGNTIGTDRAFLARDMPTFERHVHYRSVDVSSIKPPPRPGITARSPTYRNPSRSCGTTASRCSCHSRAPTVPQLRRLPIAIRAR